MRRSISSVALLFASVSAVLGSGWLFASFYTAKIAGPAAFFSWIIGGALIAIVAFTFAELSAMIPIMGSSTRIPHYTHGTVVSFLFAWIIWLSYAVLAATEVQAVLQYLSYFFPDLTNPMTAGLTGIGYIAAALLMLLICAINAFSLRWLLRFNNILTSFKLLIPLLISIVLLIIYLHGTYHIAFTHKELFPTGFHGVFAAIASGGIVFAFNGFKQACEMAGEAKKPKRSLPIAIIGSVTVCLLIYLVLQIAFIVSIHTPNSSDPSSIHAWADLHLIGGNSPFASILASKRLPVLLTLLYVGAIIGPLAAGLMYISSASRSLYGMSKNDYIPVIFQKLSPQGNPVTAIVANFVLGMLMFLPLPGWNKMVTFLTSLMAITYAIAPICLLSLRHQAPDQHRPFKLPCIRIWSWTAFYICTLLIYWSGWTVTSKLGISLILGLLIMLGYHFGSKHGREVRFDWRESIWIWPYFIGITIISYYGNFGGGQGLIPFGWDFIIIALFCVFTLWLSQKYKLPASQTQAFLKKLNLEQHNGES